MPQYRRPHIPDFRRVTRQFAAVANAVMDREVREFADDEAELFKDKIERQVFISFRRHPLTEGYIRRKRYAGADTRVLLATHWYKDHISVCDWRPTRAARRRRGLRIGFHHAVRARDLRGRITDITLDRLARVHEHGSDDQRVPPRPHWRPHLDAMTRRAGALRTRIRREIMREARRTIRWRA